MKKTTNSILIIALLLVVGLFGSCLSENTIAPEPQDNGDRAVSLRIADLQEGTRAASPGIPHNTPVQFNQGILYFTNAFGEIFYHFLLVDDNTFALGTTPRVVPAGVNTIYIGDLDDGVYIHSLRGNTRRATIVGNYPGALPTTGNISVVKSQVHHLNVRLQYNATNVNLFGSELLEPRYVNGVPAVNTVTQNRIFEAHIDLKPIVSRFEVHNIVASNVPASPSGAPATTNTITSFVLEGIFIDFFYRTAVIDGTIVSANQTTGGQDATWFLGSAAEYVTDLGRGIHDWFGHPSAGGLAGVANVALTPAGVNIWGYQVFARSHAHTRPVAPPRIILRLNNINTSCNLPFDGSNNTQFVTVTGFWDITEDEILQQIRAANVYRIENLRFNQTHLSNVPNPVDIALNVEITRAHWNGYTVAHDAPLQTPHPIDRVVPPNATNEILPLGVAWGGIRCANLAITYRWYRSNTGGDPWTFVPGSNTPSLELPPLTTTAYFKRVAERCFVSMAATPWARVTSNVARVTVGSPLWQPTPPSRFVCPGTLIQLDVARMGNATGTIATGVTYHWEWSINDWDWYPFTPAITGLNLTVPGNFPPRAYVRRVATQGGVQHFSYPGLLRWYEPDDFPDIAVRIGDNYWATRNVCFTTNNPSVHIADYRRGFTLHPLEPGMHFQWGHRLGIHPYDLISPRAWSHTTHSWQPHTWQDLTNSVATWTAENNPCPAGWRVPTRADFENATAFGVRYVTMAEAVNKRIGCRSGLILGYDNWPQSIFLPTGHFRDWINDGNIIDFYEHMHWTSTGGGQNAYFFTNSPPTFMAQLNTGSAAHVRCVRVAATPIPSANAHVTTLVNTMYDFQTQPLQTFYESATRPVSWQWQWSHTANSDNANWTNIAGAQGTHFTQSGGVWHASWSLPANFIHDAVMPNPNTQGNIYFRAVMTAPNDFISAPHTPIQIHFIRTTQTGNNDFLPGFGIQGGVRYAVLNRAVQTTPVHSGNVIRVALLNVGATNADGGLGSLFQWGRRADGHQLIGWYNNPGTRATTFTAGERGGLVTTSDNRNNPAWVPITAAGQPVEANPDFFATPVTGSHCWSARNFTGTNHAEAHNLLPNSRDLWGGGTTWTNVSTGLPAPNATHQHSNANSVTRNNAPVISTAWRTPANNPCPTGWRVPSEFEWFDMANGDGVGTPGLASITYGNLGSNREWTRRVDDASGALGGVIIRNTASGQNGTVFLPAAGQRNAAGESQLWGLGGGGNYWSSTQHSGESAGSLRLHTTTNTFQVSVPSSRALGMSVRCVRDF